MNAIKKLLLSILSLACAITLSAGVLLASKTTANASTPPTSTNTTMFMPATKLEFYNLNSPQAICYQDGYLIISEYHKDAVTGVENNKLIVYNPNTQTYEVNLSPSLVNVTCVAKYNNYVLLLIDSAIFTLSLDDISATPVDTGIRVGKSFSVNKNAIVTNTSSGIYKYNITDANGSLQFTKIDENYVTGVLSCLLTDNGDFYYFVSGTGLICRKPDGGESVIYKSVPEVDIAPSHMAEIGDYVYFTAPSGLYKVKKVENSTLTKIIAVTNDGGLGSLSSPAGITVKNGKLLVADTNLNCIQEIDPTVDTFTNFAITTESTADYRLTNNATDLCLSENYIYALDNATILDGEQNPIKRIVKISLDSQNKSYEKIDLSSVYQNNSDLESIKFACSDTHTLISDGEKVTLYKQIEGKPITLEKVFEYQKRATAVYYLDNDFYFSNYYIDVYSANEAFTQIYKLQLPSQNNELTNFTVTPITTNEENLNFSKAISGIPTDLTVDIFGNAYVLTQNSETSPTEYKIHRYYSGSVVSSNAITNRPIGIDTDFAGNVYALFDGHVSKYEFKNGATTSVNITVNSDLMALEDIALNYRSDKAYFLSDACILVTSDNSLNVQNLSRICADSVKPKELQTSQQFITVDKNAKLFKVTIGDYTVIENKNYFSKIEPISTPNTKRVYLIIADVDDDYYLISYSQKLTALVKKSSVQVNSSTSIVPPENYELLGITVENLNGESKIISNDVDTFSRPIFDSKYQINTVKKGDTVKLKTKVKFNDLTFILVEDNLGATIGYIPEGYLVDNILVKATTSTSHSNTVFEDGEKRKRDVLMIMIIAFTLTAASLLIEFKTLFKKSE